jgi:hypothetical protein
MFVIRTTQTYPLGDVMGCRLTGSCLKGLTVYNLALKRMRTCFVLSLCPLNTRMF